MRTRLVVMALLTGLATAAVRFPDSAGSEEPTQPPSSEKPSLPSIGTEYDPVYGDIVFKRLTGEIGTVPPAVFSHWVHRMRFRCYVCHDSIFKMKKGANKVVKDDIRKGKFCGVCHTGKLAWQITDENCHRCHKGPVPKPVAEKTP
ncbi:MAG: hypothetical protein HYT87_19590 [Nitrospirae bacterium]|nr:hypothetical protein [Nitrospirota bacterium]